MTAVRDLVAENATYFERAVAAGNSDVLPVQIRQIMSPADAPERFLPFLAAHRSVKLWFEDWPVARKREMVARAIELAHLQGTRAGTREFLEFVDGELREVVAYPRPFVLGRSVLGRAPLKPSPWLARHLVRVVTFTPPRAFVAGRAVLGRARLKPPSREPFRRAMLAMRTAKAPETEYRVDFAHRRSLRLSDAPLLDGSHSLNDYVSRAKL